MNERRSTALIDPHDNVRVVRGLTARQRAVLEFVIDSWERRGYGPSMREIGEDVGLSSTSSVGHVVRVLKNRGDLIGGERPHTLQPAPHRRRDNHACPVCGHVRVNNGNVA